MAALHPVLHDSRHSLSIAVRRQPLYGKLFRRAAQ
jgi:hypothetical protein